jgi:nicotinate-nucleotide adenylyltransferase
MAERLGILGGTFDPVHIGHLLLAVRAREQLSLGRVLLIPNLQSPLKASAPVAEFTDRLSMVTLAVERLSGIEGSDIEGRRGGTSYMIDTLRELHERYEESELVLIMGSDALRDLPRWREAATIPTLATIAAVARSGEAPSHEIADALVVSMPRIDVSASEIRRRVTEQRSIDFLTPPGVVSYIRDHRLYRSHA